MKNTIILCLLAFLLGCKPNNTDNTNAQSTPRTGGNLTPTEQKAVLLAGTAVSGQAEGSISENGKALVVSISNSAVFDQEPDLLPLHASRAAWIVYKNLGEEKPSFERLDVKASIKDTTINVPYELAKLDIVKARYPIIEKVASLLVAGDYEQLYTYFDPSVMGVVKVDGLRGYCEQIEPQYGKPKSFDFRGFAFNKTSGGIEFLSLAGNLKREIKDTPLNIAIDLAKPDMIGSLNSIKFDY